MAQGLVTSKQLGSPVFELSIMRAKRKVRTRTVYSAYYYYYKGAHGIYAQYARAYHFLHGDTNTAISVNYIDCVRTSVLILTA